MSYIPNSAMPHARADDSESEQTSSIDWAEVSRTVFNEARELGRRGLELGRDLGGRGVELARQRPREAAAAGAAGSLAIIAGLAYSAWRNRSRRMAFA